MEFDSTSLPLVIPKLKLPMQKEASEGSSAAESRDRAH